MQTFKVELTSIRKSVWLVNAEDEGELYGASIYSIRERGKCLSDGEHDPEVAFIEEATAEEQDASLTPVSM